MSLPRIWVAPNACFIDARVANDVDALVGDATVTASIVSLDEETTLLDELALDHTNDDEYNYRGVTSNDNGVVAGEKYYLIITAVRDSYTNTLRTKVKAEYYQGES